VQRHRKIGNHERKQRRLGPKCWQNRVVSVGGDDYIPYRSSPVSAGPFLPPSVNSVESYLKVTSLHFAVKDRCIAGVRTFRECLAAAKFNADSMIGNDIRDGDTGVFEQKTFEYIDPNKMALIEKVGDEEETGAWAVKKIVMCRERSYRQNDLGETINWDDPVIEVHSSNPRVHPWQLHPAGQYRVRGYLVRVLRPEEVELVPLPDMVTGWPNLFRR